MTCILDQTYGKPNVSCAASTAAPRAQSREKNQIAGLPSGPFTYVRQLVSGKSESHGSAGTNGGRNPSTRNGVSPIHAVPSNVSTVSGFGTARAITSTG